MEKKKEGLELLRKPFEPHQISKLPKQAKWMTDAKGEYKNCDVCGGYHHPKAIHLDYVGHAALTDRLLDCDPAWTWEPLALSEYGLPVMDTNGGMWIRLTVCGVTRLGYGHPDGKQGGDAVKEVIGDALRNAAMRFGAALDLWHKGDLHALDKPEPKGYQKNIQKAPLDAQNKKELKKIERAEMSGIDGKEWEKLRDRIRNVFDLDELLMVWKEINDIKHLMDKNQIKKLTEEKDTRKEYFESK